MQIKSRINLDHYSFFTASMCLAHASPTSILKDNKLNPINKNEFVE